MTKNLSFGSLHIILVLARGIAACFRGGGVPGVPLSQAEPSIYPSSPERNDFSSGQKHENETAKGKVVAPECLPHILM